MASPLSNVDPFVLLYMAEVFSHVARMPRVPFMTGGVAVSVTLLHFLRSWKSSTLGRGLLSIYEYGLIPEWTWRKFGLTSSMLLSPLLHTSVPQLITNLLPFIMSGSTLETILASSTSSNSNSSTTLTYSSLLTFSVIVPNILIVLLTKMVALLPLTRTKTKTTWSRRRRIDFQKMIPYNR